MNKNFIFVWVALIAVAIIAFLGLARPESVEAPLSGTTNYDAIEAGTLAIGSGCDNEQGTCTGTTITRVNTGTCYLAPNTGATITATSTVDVTCQATAAQDASGISALTGVTSGDAVVAQLSTTTAGTTFGGLDIIGATASTTSGYIEVKIRNLTGAAYSWPQSGVASGTASYIVTDN